MEECETASVDARQLQRALRDMVALSTLSAVWSSYAPDGIARSLAETLLGTLSLDLVYIRLQRPAAAAAIELAHGPQQPLDPGQTERISTALRPFLEAKASRPPASIPNPLGSGTLHLAMVRFGVGGDHGILAAGSLRSDFPTEPERLLLGVGANQAAVVLQRKDVEHSLYEQREWLQVTLASIGDAVLTTDTRGQVVFLNPVAESLTGWTAQDALGQPLEVVFHIINEQTRQPGEHPVRQALREGRVVGLANHTLLIARDGTERPIDDSAAPIIGADGAIVGAILVFRDITERHQAEREARKREQRLRDSEASFRQLADAMPQMVWTSRPDGYLDYYNRRWYEFTGLPEGEGGDASWTPVMHPEDVQRCQDTWYAAVRDGCSYEIEYRFREQRTGEYRWHLGRALPVRDEAGQIIRWFGTCTDIHDQKDLAERLREETHTVETINRVGQALAGELDLEKVVQGVTDAGVELAGAEFGAFFYNVLDEQGEAYTLYTLSGTPRAAFEHFPLPRGTALFGPTFRGEGVVRIDDVVQDARYGKNSPYRGMPEGHLPVRSYLAVPVVSRSGEVIGGLFFGHSQPGVFTERGERIVVGIAAQAAVAVDNARLYEQATREVRERRRAEALLTAQKWLLEQVTRGTPLQEVLEALTRMIEGQSEGALCSIMLLDDAGLLHHAAGPSLPTGYLETLSGLRIGRTAGSCGTSAYRKERVVVSDIETHPLWADFRDAALKHGLRACWSDPVLSTRGEVLGTVAIYYREQRTPAAHDFELIEIATHIAGIAIERARTEEALRRSENLLRTIIDAEPECVKLVDRDGSLRFMNRAGLQMIEAEGLEQVTSACVYSLIAPEHRAAFEDLNHRIFQGESATLQFRIIGLRGAQRWMETHAVPLRNESGEITAHLAVTRDIDEQKRDEAELRRRTDELAARDREKDEFLAMLAHELRNPLAPVLNAIQVLQAHGTEDPLKQRQHAVIERQARQMARLLEDLLDVSRTSRGMVELRNETVDLRALVEQAVETSRPLLEQRRLQLDIVLPEAPLYVRADPTRIHQVMGNLLSNAAKYTLLGGQVTVTLERQAEQAVIRVADTGQGIALDILPRVFDLFVQEDRSVSRGESGLGIGLTMVQRLVQLHGGSVAAHSEGPGHGSEFTVSLPLLDLVEQPRETIAPAVSAREGGPSRRILIVDDNRDAAETLADLATIWGHEVRTVHDGPTGIKVAQEYRPDIILLDISMPGMSGYDVAQALRQNDELKGIRLVALTGYGQQEDRRRTQEAGFDEHFTKPVDLPSLRRLLDEPDW